MTEIYTLQINISLNIRVTTLNFGQQIALGVGYRYIVKLSILEEISFDQFRGKGGDHVGSSALTV